MTANGSQITLAFVGDICLGLGLMDIRNRADAQDIFRGVKPVLDEADLRIGNLECCLVDDTVDEDLQSSVMSVPVDSAGALTEARFDVLNLANNHMLDCGPKSLRAALQYCRSNNILSVGAGRDIEEAARPVTVTIYNHRIGFLAFGDTEWYYANTSSAGIAPVNRDIILRSVESIRSDVDLVVAMLHADLEFGFYPAPWRVALSRAMVDAGADLVVQHHPHVIQGIERHANGIIAYSLGNFVFRWHNNEYLGHKPGVNESIILKIAADLGSGQPELSWQAVPVAIDESGRPQLATGEEERHIREHLQTVSSELHSLAGVRQRWRQRCREELRYQWGGLYWTLRDHGPLAFLRRFKRILKRKDHQRWIKGLLTFGYR